MSHYIQPGEGNGSDSNASRTASGPTFEARDNVAHEPRSSAKLNPRPMDATCEPWSIEHAFARARKPCPKFAFLDEIRTKQGHTTAAAAQHPNFPHTLGVATESVAQSVRSRFEINALDVYRPERWEGLSGAVVIDLDAVQKMLGEVRAHYEENLRALRAEIAAAFFGRGDGQ